VDKVEEAESDMEEPDFGLLMKKEISGTFWLRYIL
jgi:hypothetical protein